MLALPSLPLRWRTDSAEHWFAPTTQRFTLPTFRLSRRCSLQRIGLKSLVTARSGIPPLRPKDHHILRVGYKVTSSIHENNKDVCDERAEGRASVNGKLVGEESRLIRDLQSF